MDQFKRISTISIRSILVLWVAVCCIAAFFMPHYDLGFDGVKIWFYLCVLMLASMLVGRSFLQYLGRHVRS
ncbi:hypothetical protein JCM12296A_21300 [Desulfosarcina cetonica]|uniref:hypothetical protein n=1 Tax=Desulfosarcina cetonica TaxID=90730 RepID=UPI0006D104ED|nr:hypothetical protein [Desulfosarcina cetonica]